MSDIPAQVLIREEGPREGFQIEAGPIPTADKVALIDALSTTGLRHIQIVSFVSPRRVPGMADAMAVAQAITPQPGVEYTAIWFNEQGLQSALNAPNLTVTGKVRLYPSTEFLKRNLNRTPEEHLHHTEQEIARYLASGIPVTELSISSAFGCNFHGSIGPGEVLPLLEFGMALADRFGLHFDSVTLADTMAWATPQSIERLIGEVRSRYPDLPLSLHLHDTRGMGIANAYAGLQMGITRFDSSLAGLGGCPFAAHKGAAGNLCTEDFVFMCEEMGVQTGIDLDALIECAAMAERIVGHPLPGSVMRGGSLARLRRTL